MKPYDPETFGRQLRKEMKAAGVPNAKQLEERLKKFAPGARGLSYTAVLQYVNGDWPSEPHKEAIQAMAGFFGVLPDCFYGGPRTPEAKAMADKAAEREAGDFFDGLMKTVMPEYEALDFDSKAMLHKGIVRFHDAAPKEWLPPEDETSAFAMYVTEFAVMARNVVFMPLWAWTDTPDLSDSQVQDYVRSALAAFIQSIPDRLPRPPIWRLGTLPGQDIQPYPPQEGDNDGEA